jgi:hypothetical protein
MPKKPAKKSASSGTNNKKSPNTRGIFLILNLKNKKSKPQLKDQNRSIVSLKVLSFGFEI